MMSATSACVGFWPSALSRSPRTSRCTLPVPFLSKSAKASLYSALSLYASRNRRDRARQGVRGGAGCAYGAKDFMSMIQKKQG